MPRYILEAKFEAYSLLHHAHSEFRQKVSFEARDNRSAFVFAFDSEISELKREDKKLFLVTDEWGSTKRIYEDD